MEVKPQEVPVDATEYSKYLETQSSRIPNTDELKSRNPVMDYYAQINPIDPVTPSENWATARPRKGFDMSHMNTYQVRDGDILQAALFDRFVLKDDTSLFPDRLDTDMSLGKMIVNRLGQPVRSFKDIKKYGRGTLQGRSYSSIKKVEEDKIKKEKM